MERGERPLALSPSRWPVRWRFAGVSAGLTFVILLVFAAGVGRLVENRLRADFRGELEAKANELALSVRLDPATGEPLVEETVLRQIAQGADGPIRLVDSPGPSARQRLMPRALPPPEPGSTVSFNGLEVATRQVLTTSLTQPPTSSSTPAITMSSTPPSTASGSSSG